MDADIPAKGQQGQAPIRAGEAMSFYQRAADLRSSTILEYMHAREKVAECQIDLGDHHSAVAVLTEVSGMAEQYGGRSASDSGSQSVYSDVLARCEVSRVLLLLLIEPAAMSSLPPDLTAVLDKYTWESDDLSATEETAKFLSEDVSISHVVKHVTLR